MWIYCCRILAKIRAVFFCVSRQYTRERSQGNMENCQDSLQAVQSIRAKKGGGEQYMESSNIKGVTLFKNVKALYSVNLKRINLTYVLHRCPCMWNCSNGRGLISARRCIIFIIATPCVCVDAGNAHCRLWKLTMDCLLCVKAVGALTWLTLS
jgi:hypothetical protein